MIGRIGFLILVLSLSLSLGPSRRGFAADSHEKKPENSAPHQQHEHEDDGDEQGGRDEHDDHDQHGEHGEEAPANVGPGKGMTSFDEHEGFSLSPEATKTFGIETQKLQGGGAWQVPVSTLVNVGAEKSVFRLRDGKYKRVIVSSAKPEQARMRIESRELKSGDQVVVKGGGFLRVAELDATSGESGHHH